MTPVRPPERQAKAILCVSGLAVEARIARRAGFPAVVGAGDRRRTARLVATAMTGIRCVVSFGIAGALSPSLRPGDLVLSAEIVSERGCWRGDDAWRRRLVDIAAVIGAASGPVLAAAQTVATPTGKAHARMRFGALAVDLESDIVASAATQDGIRFAALRAIADPAERQIPPAALIPLAADGTPALAQILASVLRRARQVPSLVGLARETRRALKALEEAAPALHRLID